MQQPVDQFGLMGVSRGIPNATEPFVGELHTTKQFLRIIQIKRAGSPEGVVSDDADQPVRCGVMVERFDRCHLHSIRVKAVDQSPSQAYYRYLRLSALCLPPQRGSPMPAQAIGLGHDHNSQDEAPTGNAVKHFLREKLGFR